MLVNALSVDLEDWFHPELVRPLVTDAWPERRIEWAVEPILILLERYEVQATFFVLGEVMRHHPDLIQRLRQQGHEIGCHGWSHRPLWTIDPDRFAWQLMEYDRDAEPVMPVDEIVGFRAPTFSLDERTAWAIDVLRAHGYRYDSSIFPVRTFLYGVDGSPLRPYRPTREELTRDHQGEQFLEFPLAVCDVAGLRVPVSGGFYMRAIPSPILRSLLARINAQGDPFAIYMHPWEADVQTPRPKGLSLLSRFVTYYNAKSVLRKLEELLQSFRFAPLRDVLGAPSRRGTLSLSER